MGTVYVTDVANIRTSPPTLTPVTRAGGKVRMWQGNYDFAATSDMDVADIVVIARVPWNLRLASLRMAGDSLGDALNADIGLYYPDGTVIDVDEFASAVDLDLEVFTEFAFESAAGDIDRVGEALWEWAGLTALPTTYFGLVDIALTITTSTNPAVGTIAWQITGTVD